MAKQDLKYSLGLLVTTIAFYFELAFFIFPTKWDNLSAYFPYKYTASHWWLNGRLPLWDFYQNLGYPMHANPQGYVWYPITWLFSLPSEYNLYSLNLELLFHIWVAAVGMYFFAKHLNISAFVGFCVAMAYSASGYMLGTSHMIGFTIAAAWLPWVLLFYRKILVESKLKNTVVFAIVTYFFITGAYTAFTIVLFYILLILFGLTLISQKNNRIEIIKRIGIAGVLILTLCSPYLYSIYDSLPYITRSTAVVYSNEAMGGNFTWQCFQSLVAPFIVSSKTGFTGVDVSLANIYIGMPFLVFFLLYWFSVKSRYKALYAFAIALFFLLALGIHTPVHYWFYKAIPGFSLFRHPYLFNLFALFLMLVLGAKALDKIVKENNFKLLYSIFGIASVLLFVGVIISYYNGNWHKWVEFRDLMYQLADRSTLNNYSHAFINWLLVLPLVIALTLYSRKSISKNAIGLILFLDLLFCVQLNAPKNMFYNTSFGEFKTYLTQNHNDALTNQAINTSLASLQNDSIKAAIGFWVNLNTYQRTTGINGYNPFVFTDFKKLQQRPNYPKLLQKGLIFAPDSFSFTQENCYSILENTPSKTQIQPMLSNLKLDYNSLQFEVNTTEPCRIFINQNFHHNWKAMANGMPLIIDKANVGLMSVEVPKGDAVVMFNYANSLIKIMHYLSVFTLVSLLGFISWINIKVFET
ncbi:MAG: hypothetical protein RLZZ337_1287 [Bacteroidota bacterium]|jgi:hypothetical protein